MSLYQCIFRTESYIHRRYTFPITPKFSWLGRADALCWCPVVCATEHVGLIVVVTPEWLGRCCQLESSPARCLINDFPALHGRQNDQVTVRWHSNGYWQTYRHTWSISFEFSLSLWRSTPCYEMLFSQSICLYVCLCVRQSACRSVSIYDWLSVCVYVCLYSFNMTPLLS
jgi:hypothetical protein